MSVLTKKGQRGAVDNTVNGSSPPRFQLKYPLLRETLPVPQSKFAPLLVHSSATLPLLVSPQDTLTPCPWLVFAWKRWAYPSPSLDLQSLLYMDIIHVYTSSLDSRLNPDSRAHLLPDISTGMSESRLKLTCPRSSSGFFSQVYFPPSSLLSFPIWIESSLYSRLILSAL